MLDICMLDFNPEKINDKKTIIVRYTSCDYMVEGEEYYYNIFENIEGKVIKVGQYSKADIDFEIEKISSEVYDIERQDIMISTSNIEYYLENEEDFESLMEQRLDQIAILKCRDREKGYFCTYFLDKEEYSKFLYIQRELHEIDMEAKELEELEDDDYEAKKEELMERCGQVADMIMWD